MQTENIIKKKSSRALVKLTALSLTTALLLSSFGMPFGRPVKAENQQELEARQEQINRDLAAAQQDLANAKAADEELSQRIYDLRAQSKLKEEEVGKLEEELAAAGKRYADAVERYKKSNEALNTKRKEYEQRITALFRIRHKSTLEVLLESDSIDGFFTNMKLMAYMSSVDQGLINQLDFATQEAEQAKKEADETKKTYDSYLAQRRQDLEDIAKGLEVDLFAKSKVDAAVSDKYKDVEFLESQQIEITAEIEALQAEQDALARKAIEEELERRRQEAVKTTEAPTTEATTTPAPTTEAPTTAAPTTTGANGETDPPPPPTQAPTTAAPTAAPTAPPTRPAIQEEEVTITPPALLYPVAGYYRISDGYGPRDDPESPFHYAIDFPAPVGTPVRSSTAGKVVIASAPLQGQAYGWANWGLGNYVSIMTNTGYVLLYCHLSYVAVSEGQYVDAGDYIGKIGSTGYSTGPHLHFVLRPPFNKTPGINPEPYLYG